MTQSNYAKRLECAQLAAALPGSRHRAEERSLYILFLAQAVHLDTIRSFPR